MARTRTKTKVERRGFVRGLITEATALTYPENASIDEDNYVLNQNGSRQRRLGMDYETGYALTTSAESSLFNDFSLKCYRWDSPNNDSNVTIGVIQIGNKLWFYDLQTDAPSSNLLNGGVAYELNAANVGQNISGNYPVEFTPINGKLVAVSKELPSPVLFSYNSTSDAVTSTLYTISVRDVWGVNDTFPVNYRPTLAQGASAAHKYNLWNQGWDNKARITRWQGKHPENSTHTPLASFVNERGQYPSNADVWQVFKTVDATGDDAGITFFDPVQNDAVDFGTTPAPKGRVVIDLFARGTSRGLASGLVLPSVDQDLSEIAAVASFAGRVFYSGFSGVTTQPDTVSPKLAEAVAFTQLVKSDASLGKCYTEADPTSEHDSALVATDGGLIFIPGAANILKLIATEASLIVVAEGGIWEITGPDRVFSASNFSITKITGRGALSAGSVVEVEGAVFYWGSGGIYVVSPDASSGRMVATNLTEKTIQTFYNNIANVAKLYVTGEYDELTKTVRWLYNDSDDFDGLTLKTSYNKELVYNFNLQAFYTHTIQNLSGVTELIGDIQVVAENKPTITLGTNVNFNSSHQNSDGEILLWAWSQTSTGGSTAVMRKYIYSPVTGITEAYTEYPSFTRGIASGHWVGNILVCTVNKTNGDWMCPHASSSGAATKYMALIKEDGTYTTSFVELPYPEVGMDTNEIMGYIIKDGVAYIAQYCRNGASLSPAYRRRYFIHEVDLTDGTILRSVDLTASLEAISASSSINEGSMEIYNGELRIQYAATNSPVSRILIEDMSIIETFHLYDRLTNEGTYSYYSTTLYENGCFFVSTKDVYYKEDITNSDPEVFLGNDASIDTGGSSSSNRGHMHIKDGLFTEVVPYWSTTAGPYNTFRYANVLTTPFLAGIMRVPGFSSTAYVQDVVVNGEPVVVNGEQVVVTEYRRSVASDLASIKYLVIEPNVGSEFKFTLANYNNTGFLDWETRDSVGADAAAYLKAGWEFADDTQRRKQTNYFTLHCLSTETAYTGTPLAAVNPSSCLITTRWDFSNHANSGKIGQQFQGYRLRNAFVPTAETDPFNYGWEVVTTRSKLRGSGKSLSLEFNTEPAKDCIVLGWGMDIEVSNDV